MKKNKKNQHTCLLGFPSCGSSLDLLVPLTIPPDKSVLGGLGGLLVVLWPPKDEVLKDIAFGNDWDALDEGEGAPAGVPGRPSGDLNSVFTEDLSSFGTSYK